AGRGPAGAAGRGRRARQPGRLLRALRDARALSGHRLRGDAHRRDLRRGGRRRPPGPAVRSAAHGPAPRAGPARVPHRRGEGHDMIHAEEPPLVAADELRAARWRTSTRSGNGSGNCVEVARLRTAVAVRDSKDPDGPVLIFTPGRWSAFVNTAKDGTL